MSRQGSNETGHHVPALKKWKIKKMAENLMCELSIVTKRDMIRVNVPVGTWSRCPGRDIIIYLFEIYNSCQATCPGPCPGVPCPDSRLT